MGSLKYLKRSPSRTPETPDVDHPALSDADIDRLFDRIDVDRSGALSQDEVRAFLSDLSGLRRGHRNVSDEEFAIALHQLDQDDDGVVSKADLAAYIPRHGFGHLLETVTDEAPDASP